MSAAAIISIDNLSCSYTGRESERVLFIPTLEIQKGKIIFLLGPSGSGKSTLLETLGLMNNTIVSGQVTIEDNSGGKIELSNLWKNGNEEEINKIRKNYLSFIFQNTNLMENFSAYENICLSQMIKSNSTQLQAMDGAVALMKQVQLPLSQVGYDTLSVNLSGGQRQRVSFVRALNSDFKILLCDEPTGNLDEINAAELLNIVKQNLTSERTAILVSHDINLALKYADEIILLTRNPEHGYGEILTENIYRSKEWKSLDHNSLAQFRGIILKSFQKKEKISEDGASNNHSEFLPSYKKLFIKKEGKVLFGKSKINLFILVTIVSLTLLAIGFANGALDYLNNKLSDAFVNWMTVGIPYSKSSGRSVTELTDALNTKEVREQFKIDTITVYTELALPLFRYDSYESEFIRGRIISEDDPVKSELFGDANRLLGKTDFNERRDLGIVVSTKLMERLGYPPDAKVIYLDNYDIDSTKKTPQKIKVPVPVRAVIKEIPGKNRFLITSFFYFSHLATDECVFNLKDRQRKRIMFFVDGDEEFAGKFKGEIEKIAGAFNLIEGTPPDSSLPGSPYENSYQELSVEVDVQACKQMYIDGHEISVNFSSIPFSYATTEAVYDKIVAMPFFKNNEKKITRILDYDIAEEQDESNIRNDYLSINFKGSEGGLDKIDAFSVYLSKEFNSGKEREETNVIEIDSGAIKEKKNFNYISKMTLLISSLLIVFSILAISLFLSNLLKTHLNKVKTNLGTFKAFGLGNSESKNIYLQIMLRFIFIGLAISFLIALLLGSVIEIIFRNWLKIEDEIQYFQIFDFKTYILLIIIVALTVFVSYFNINRILSKTPGDLIYNR